MEQICICQVGTTTELMLTESVFPKYEVLHSCFHKLQNSYPPLIVPRQYGIVPGVAT
jgi:hypothetical protein